MTEEVESVELRASADPQYQPTYRVAEEWRDRCLLGGQSLFGEGEVWSSEVSGEFKRRFIDGADEGAGTFLEKLDGQLDGAPQAVYQLAAETLFVHLLALRNVSLSRKLAIINGVGHRAPEPFEVPERLVDVLAHGIIGGGVGFNTNRFWLVSFLIEFTERWVALEPDAQSSLAADPWQFKELLYSIAAERADGQRNALLFLLFSETFEDIGSLDHKRQIVGAHTTLAGDNPDIDRQLLAVRTGLNGTFGENFNWYADNVRATWDTTHQPALRSMDGRSAAELLADELADDRVRANFAALVAEAIIAAHEVNPRSWSVSQRGHGITLNVGKNRTLAAIGGKQSMLFTCAEKDISGRLDGVGLGGAETFSYASPTDCALVTTRNLADFNQALTELRADHLDAVRRAASGNTPYWRYFSEEAVLAIEDAAGVELPRPDRSNGDSGAWVVRMKRDGKRVVREAVARGDCRIFWSIGVEPGASIDEVRAAMAEADPDATPNELRIRAGNVHRFVSRIEVGDLVVSPDGPDLYVGAISSDPVYEQDAGEWVREVDWLNASDPIQRSDVGPALYSRLKSNLTITEISDLAGDVLAFVDNGAETEELPTPGGPSVTLPSIDSDTAAKLLLDRDWLQDVVEMLAEQNQLIFFGPPGTGKTFLAESLARHLVTDPANYKIVQFHPSYAYEDFVEGFRPQVDAKTGNMVYELRPGPFKQLAEEARNNPSEPYVLIIDEINRGNLAKIFGELYYLLEYRDDPIVLQYGSGTEDEFSLPDNLFVIGTMNTADRSIAMVDAAIRRRFWFVEFSPTVAPIDGLLRRWLAARVLSDRPARILEELNSRLGDNEYEYAIGPSYLMNKNIDDDKVLNRIWDHAIMPLLTEHFYGQPDATDRFKLSKLLRAIDSGTVPAEEEQIESGAASTDPADG